MKLVVFELKSAGLFQQLKTQDEDINVEAIRPHIYRHNFATGDVFIEIQDDTNQLIATSNVVAISTLFDTTSQNFFHGYIRFDIKVFMKADTVYTIALKASGGYSFAESAYVGWVNDYDLQKYDRNYVPVDDFQKPLDMEVWDRTVLPKQEDIDV